MAEKDRIMKKGPFKMKGSPYKQSQKKFGPIIIGGRRKVPRFSLIEKAHEKGLGALVEAQDWTELKAASKIKLGKLKKRLRKKNK